MKANIKKGGKYIVFIPATAEGEDKKIGQAKIDEYKKKMAEEYLKDIGINAKFYSMIGGDDNNNKKQLDEFQNNLTGEDETKFMIVIDKANEGLHIDGVDGIVWLRPLDENSRILYLQQLGRCIYSEDPNNPTKDEDRPVVIDLVNNTLRVDIDKYLKQKTNKDDLELLTTVVEWVNKYNIIPDIESTSKKEQRYAATLYRIQNKYMKYLNGFEKFPNLEKDKIEQIESILGKGAEIDLWDIQLLPKKQEVIDEILKIDTFEITGILRNFVELEKEVDKVTLKRGNLLENALEIRAWCEDNYKNKSVWERKLPSAKSEDKYEKKIGSKLKHLSERIKLYEGMKPEEIENEEYRQIVVIMRKLKKEYDLGGSLKNAIEIKAWCEENYSDKPNLEKKLPKQSSKNEYEKN